MSRIVLSAMRKHKNASAFVEKFLLPSLKRGKIPARTIGFWRKKRGFFSLFNNLRLPSRKQRYILFYDISRPERICTFSIQRIIPSKGKPRNPRVRLFRHLYLKVRAEEPFNDWSQGKRLSGVIRDTDPVSKNVYESIALTNRELKHWKPVRTAVFRGKKYKYYGLKHELFEELLKYNRASSRIIDLGSAIDFLRGRISKKHFSAVLRISEMADPKNPYFSMLKVFGASDRLRIARILGQALINIPQTRLSETKLKMVWKKIAGLIGKEFDVSERYAFEALAPTIVFGCIYGRKAVERLVFDLENFPNIQD
jgi:hypothetical protein